MDANPDSRPTPGSDSDSSNKPTAVFFVRHGKTSTTGAVLPGRAKGLNLSEEGQSQAKAAGQRLAALKKQPISAIYASPLERTQQTASAIGEQLELEVKTDHGLIEADFGAWTGKKLSDLRKLPEWKNVQRYPSGFRFPDGEAFGEMQLRITGSVKALTEQHPGEAIVCVSHADPIKAALAHALGTHLDLFQRLVVGPCSISLVLYGSSGPTVLAANSTSELSDLVPS